MDVLGSQPPTRKGHLWQCWYHALKALASLVLHCYMRQIWNMKFTFSLSIPWHEWWPIGGLLSFKICHLDIPRNLPVPTHAHMKSDGVEEIRSGMGVFATFLSSKEERGGKGFSFNGSVDGQRAPQFVLASLCVCKPSSVIIGWFDPTKVSHQ